MGFSKQQLQKFADSIRIEFSDKELESMNVDQVYDWMKQMQNVDTTGIEPMFTPVGHAAPIRQDVVTNENMRDLILKNAPDDTGKPRGYFAVPKVMDE